MRSPTSMRKTSPKSLEGKNRSTPSSTRGKQAKPREHARGVASRQPYCRLRGLAIVCSEVAVTGAVDLNCASVGVDEADACAGFDPADPRDRESQPGRERRYSFCRFDRSREQQLVVVTGCSKVRTKLGLATDDLSCSARQRQFIQFDDGGYIGCSANMTEISEQSIGDVDHRTRDARQKLTQLDTRVWQLKPADQIIASLGCQITIGPPQYLESKEGVTDRSGNPDEVAGAGAAAPNLHACSDFSDGGQRQDGRARCSHGIAAQQLDAEASLILLETLSEAAKPLDPEFGRQSRR